MNIWKAAANDFACVATCSVHARFEPVGFIGLFAGREGGGGLKVGYWFRSPWGRREGQRAPTVKRSETESTKE